MIFDFTCYRNACTMYENSELFVKKVKARCSIQYQYRGFQHASNMAKEGMGQYTVCGNAM